MELRQLRYFVTLAEELHFGHAATREHIVQSALSQQLQRLERELGVRLLERTTHHVRLTQAGAAFLVEAREILAQVDRAATVARDAARATPSLRVGVVDASYDSMPQILRETQRRYPDLDIHQVEVSVPESMQLTVNKVMKHDPSCGAMQWFKPFSTLEHSSMGVAEAHSFSGQGLGTKWSAPDKRSAFFGTFAY